MALRDIPVGTTIHNIEMHPGRGAQLVRSAGASASLMAKEGKYAQLRMPSGEYRLIPTNCRATIGTVGNIEHENIKIGKAGRQRHKGLRPSVRGLAMNPLTIRMVEVKVLHQSVYQVRVHLGVNRLLAKTRKRIRSLINIFKKT